MVTDRGSLLQKGPHGSADLTNDNGERFTLLCNSNGISIGNTFFKHERIHKTTWTSLDGSTLNEVDYVCISSRWRSYLNDVRTFRGADVASDHKLVVAKIRLRLKKMSEKKYVRPFAVEKLKDKTICDEFCIDVSNRFAMLQHAADFADQWKIFQETIKDSAEQVIGRRRGSRKERWISKRSWKLIDKRKAIKIAHDQINSDETWKINNAEYKKKDKEVKKSCKNDQRQLVEDRGREAEEAAARSDSKTLYRIVRDLTGNRNITNVTIKSRNREVLLTEIQQSSRWWNTLMK